jgi:hypothetical protein
LPVIGRAIHQRLELGAGLAVGCLDRHTLIVQ